MTYEHCGKRLRLFAGDISCPDDPRGREASVHFEFGLPVGEFDPPKIVRGKKTVKAIGGAECVIAAYVPNPDYQEYGTWGFSVTLWRWGIGVGMRGPVLGSWPPDEDD